jgi:hypothetical protein
MSILTRTGSLTAKSHRKDRRWEIYIRRCRKISGGHHGLFGYEKSYLWTINNEYKSMKVSRYEMH